MDLRSDAFGEPRDPAILLIGGGGATMDWWDPAFCRRLAEGARFVLRYDHRDTGESVHYPPGEPGYGFDDLVTDALRVLGEYGIERAHVVGVSMGGTIAQHLAVRHPARVESLTLISTSPGWAGLPPMSPRLEEYFAVQPMPSTAEHLVEFERQLAAPAYFDEARTRAVAERVIARSGGLACASNHALIEPPEPVRHRLGEIAVPTLVVHGTADPLFPFEHAEALAREIPGAELLPLDGVGHQMPPPSSWDTVVPALLRHTSGGWDAQAARLAARSIARDDPTGWFDRLYSAGVAGEVPMPWDRGSASPLLVDWARERTARGRAVVVGCGLGADAEYLAELGWATTAFDVSPTAIEVAAKRYPESTVDYRVADLLALPAELVGAFDLVVENFTVQALPRTHRAAATAAVASLVAPGGTLLVIARRDEGEQAGPPWPLTREEVEAFAAGGLALVRVEELDLWRAEFRRASVG
ncbi:alpha/beta fold hydrolase [Amycolatopsis sacchari]|uniref:alpha/beta fold hydrolase n=1 Tax=Amycolatopsis sacchari TaxID=115433 RepID=UPI003D7536EF